MVSDSTTYFVAGRRTRNNILSDLLAAKQGALSPYTEIIYEPLWGKTLSEITEKAIQLVDQTVVRYGHDPELFIDVNLIWLANELVDASSPVHLCPGGRRTAASPSKLAGRGRRFAGASAKI